MNIVPLSLLIRSNYQRGPTSSTLLRSLQHAEDTQCPARPGPCHIHVWNRGPRRTWTWISIDSNKSQYLIKLKLKSWNTDPSKSNSFHDNPIELIRLKFNSLNLICFGAVIASLGLPTLQFLLSPMVQPRVLGSLPRDSACWLPSEVNAWGTYQQTSLYIVIITTDWFGCFLSMKFLSVTFVNPCHHSTPCHLHKLHALHASCSVLEQISKCWHHHHTHRLAQVHTVYIFICPWEFAPMHKWITHSFSYSVCSVSASWGPWKPTRGPVCDFYWSTLIDHVTLRPLWTAGLSSQAATERANSQTTSACIRFFSMGMLGEHEGVQLECWSIDWLWIYQSDFCSDFAIGDLQSTSKGWSQVSW